MAESAPGSPPSPEPRVSPGAAPELRLAPAAKTRARAWLVGLCALLASGALLIVGAIAAVLLYADAPWLKPHLCVLIARATGIEIDYESLRLTWPGELVVRDLAVRAPAELRAASPELLRVGALRVESPLATLVRGTPIVESITADAVEFTLALDEQGRSSFDYLTGSSSGSEASATPPSKLGEVLLGSELPLRRLRLTDAQATLVWIAQGQVVGKDALRGLTVEADAEARDTGVALHVRLGSTAAPLTLTLHRSRRDQPEQAISLHTSMDLVATAQSARAALELEVHQQNITQDLPPNQRAAVAAEVRFDPARERTEIVLSRVAVGDDIVRGEAKLELSDHGASVLREAHAEADLGRLARLLPPWLVPFSSTRGQVRLDAKDLALDAPTRPASAELEAEDLELELALPQGTLRAQGVRAQVRATPRDGGIFAEGTLAAGQVHVEQPGLRVRSEDVSVAFAEHWSADDRLTGQAELELAALDVQSAQPIRCTRARVRLDNALSMRAPLAQGAEATLEASCAALERRGALPLHASHATLWAHAQALPASTLDLTAKLGAQQARLHRADGTTLLDDPLALEFALSDVGLDVDGLERSQGRAQARASAGALVASVEATLHQGRLDYGARASAPRLAAVKGLEGVMPQALRYADAELTLRSKGRLTRLTAAPELEHESELRLGRIALRGVSADALTLRARSRGTVHKHAGALEATLERLAFEGAAIGEAHLSLTGSRDGQRTELALRLDSPSIPKLSAQAALEVSDADGSLRYTAQAALSELGPLAPLATKLTGGLDVTRLDVTARSQGSLHGLLAAASEPAPDRAARGGQGDLELEVRELRWAEHDRLLIAPRAVASTRFELGPAHHRFETDLRVDALELRVGELRFDAEGWRDHSTVQVTGDITEGVLELSQRASVRSLRQNLAAAYPIGELSWSLRALRDRDGVIKLSGLELENRAGGTVLSASGGVLFSEDHHQLSLQSSLRQDVAALSTQPASFTGRGKVTIELSVASPNLQVFQTSAVLHVQNAHVRLPRAQLALEAMDGEIPVLLDFTLSRAGPRLLRGVQINPYATLRFADQHPMLSTRSFVSIDRVETPLATFAPFAANLTVEQNVVSLAQIELGVRGGTVTGNGLLQWNPSGSTLELNVHASGVRSSRGEPFDGNAALSVNLADRSVRGRADILRIGRRHLLDLLDLQDPHHADPSMNHVRRALRLGYPDRVRISFNHGFAHAGVSFGGLARFLRVADVRGIPIGPLVERTLRTLQLGEVR